MQSAGVSMSKRTGGARIGCRLVVSVCFVTLAVCLPTAGAQAAQGTPGAYADPREPGMVSTVTPPQLAGVGFKQRLNQMLPLDATFKDDNGLDVTLGQLFGSRPVILAFVYYQCPMLCTQVMNGLSSALKVMPFAAGKDYDVVLVSFDPRDRPAIAAEKKRAHLAYWSAERDASSWHLLSGDETSIRRAASAAGFTYQWDERTGQFAHVSGVLVVTPEGRLSRYFYGVEFSPKELRLALVESGEGKIGSAIDELLLYCFHYNPENGRYGLIVMNVIRLGGLVTVVAMGGFILLMRRRDVRGPVAKRA